MYRLIVSLRYLRSKKVNFFPISGVAVGVMVLTVIMSVMNGFVGQMRDRIRGTLSDLIVSQGGGPFPLDDVVDRIHKIPHVVACSPRLEGLAFVRLRNVRRWGLFEGIDPELEKKVGKFAQYVGSVDMQGKFQNTPIPKEFQMGVDPKGPWPIIVSAGLLNLGGDGEAADYVQPGESVTIYTLVGIDEHSLKRFTLSSSFKSGMSEYDSQYMYMPLDLAQKLRKVRDMITAIYVKLDDPRHTQEVRQAIKKELDSPGRAYLVQTWEEKRFIILRAVAVEKGIQAVILFFIIIVAGFMVLAILHMIVVEKTKDIGIIKSLGGTSGGIMSIFLLNGLAVGVIGSTVGVILGVIFTHNLNWLEDVIFHWTGWRVFPPDVYYLDNIPWDIQPMSVAVCAFSAIAVSFLAGIYPAWRAARLDPIQALRYE